MPYQRANAILANFRTGVSKGQFGDLMGTDFKFRLSPSETAARWSTSGGGGGDQSTQPQQQGGGISRTSLMQPPGEAGAAGRTGPGDADIPALGTGRTIQSAQSSELANFRTTRIKGGQIPTAPASSGGESFGRDILRASPNSQGVTQQGVTRPLSQARRFGL